ncbi:MAG: hypothetical protein AAF591_18955 [Verrucomicrobiota bacterium]
MTTQNTDSPATVIRVVKGYFIEHQINELVKHKNDQGSGTVWVSTLGWKANGQSKGEIKSGGKGDGLMANSSPTPKIKVGGITYGNPVPSEKPDPILSKSPWKEKPPRPSNFRWINAVPEGYRPSRASKTLMRSRRVDWSQNFTYQISG